MGLLQKKALNGHCTLWFLDESGASLTPLIGATWAPKGMRIALPTNFGPWDKVGMIGVVGANGKLYFRFKVARSEGIQAKDVASFLRQLLRHEPGQVVVFWDGATQHKGPFIRRLLARHRRLRLIRLPPYGYDYNPSEGPWQYLKWVVLKNFNPQGTPELVRTLRRGLRRMQRRSGLVRSFFRQSKLPRKGLDVLLKHYRTL